ncbi:HD-GYP domain-containing protein [Aestuariicella sp. G3-2]|uniref:HD-GYP domain-containing protein n=1 Tax=Pseudomaricurvus albidus TaxID=2842452 RepID=UPI001C0A98E0|nr:HD-GYP domain-containing protein [Aestuariicella albida]MBU3069701.1 HD-GYP domain-containing protein [Aestuariicella albida]
MTTIKKVSLEQLKVGMYVTRVDEACAAGANLRAQGLITREDTIERFRQQGMLECFIDVAKGDDCSEGIPLDQLHQPKASPTAFPECDQDFPVPRVAYEDERDNALRVRDKALRLVSDVMHDVKMGRSIDREAVDEIALDITESLVNNQNVLLSLMYMGKKDEYLLEHSMNVAVLMGVLARSLGYRAEKLHHMVLGAFVHDVGKIRVPESILHKPGKLELAEWEEMKRHVDYGIEALSTVENFPDIAMAICAEHHERLDGTGYPYSRPAVQISQQGRMGAVVDVYDAITSDRVYHQGLEPNAALKKMLEWSGDHLDKELVYQLIRCVGVYPAGSLVQLGSGHVAVVLEVSSGRPAQPRVKLVYDGIRQQRISERVVSLAETDLYGEVMRAVAPSQFGLNVRDYL